MHVILQARILEWVAISSSRESSNARMDPVSLPLARRVFNAEPPRKPADIVTCFLF